MTTIEKTRKAIEKFYDSVCDVVEYKAETDVVNKRTTYKEVKIFENVKCRVSFKNISSSNQSNISNNIAQQITLFIEPDLDIKPGSKIIVTSKGRINEYKNSGIPAVYSTHQEIILDNFKGWA